MKSEKFRTLSGRALVWLETSLRIPPWLTGILAAAAMGGFALWFCVLTGVVADVQSGRAPDIAVRAPVTLYIITGYFPVAIYYLWMWTTRHFATLNQQFNLHDAALAFPRRSAAIAGAAGSIAMYIAFLHRPSDPFYVLAPSRWDSTYGMPLVGLLLMGWFNFRFMYLLVWTSSVISRSATRIRNLDLLDTFLLRPYGQQGVRSSLLAIISLSISANLWLDSNSPKVGTGLSIALLVAASLVALFLPTWGIHQSLKATKDRELRELRAAISSRRSPESRSLEDAQQLRADLAMEQRLQAVSEWPFDAGSYGRVALYIFLGLGSWVGAALVEHGLELAF